MPRFWLMKCEPDAYSIHDLARDGRTGWDGIRNYQVRNFIRDDMRAGDLGIFYHSNASPTGAAGVLEIRASGLADPTQFDQRSDYHDPKSDPSDPTWLMCEVGFVEAFDEVVTLEALRSEASLAEMAILKRGNRLSITPLTAAEFRTIRRMGASGAVSSRNPAPRQAKKPSPSAASGSSAKKASKKAVKTPGGKSGRGR